MTTTQVLDPDRSDYIEIARSGYIEITPEILSADYMAEARNLAYAAEQADFDQTLARLHNYPAYLRSIKKHSSHPLKHILQASSGTRIVDTSTTSAIIWDALLTSHVAACCELFQGSRLLREQFTLQILVSMAQKFIANYQSANKKEIDKVANKLGSMDAVRSMQLLRTLGLIQRKTSTFQQLALGASDGTRDMYSLHKMPEISHSRSLNGLNYVFHVIQEYVKHIIITDLDPSHQALYEEYNQQSSPPVLAICAEMMDMLRDLPGRKLKKRNLVTAIRIDHRMLPDVPGFLSLLSRNIDDQCHLIMSIGAGNTGDEFIGRVDKLAEVFNVLEKASLQPVLLKIHGPGSYIEQHASLRFGNPSISTYQILYCNLRKRVLHKKFDRQ